jgi:hypothetical protein
MLRHTALFMWRDSTNDAQKLMMKKGLAYLRYGCLSVREVDFGEDLLGGSSTLLQVKPYRRTPLWKARETGPACNFDVTLNLDFDDAEGLKQYNLDEVHHEVGEYDASVCRPERTARVDWWYEGPSLVHRGWIRHTALYLWADGATDGQKKSVREGLLALKKSIPVVRSLVTGDNIGTLTTDYDLILDVQFADMEGVRAYFEHPALREAAALTAGLTKNEWTARITHRMLSG